MTASLRLLVAVLDHPEVGLVANEVLVREWRRHASNALIEGLLAKANLVNPGPASLAATAQFFTGKAADWLHAATCLEAGAVLVSNDRDFNGIAEAGLIEVWRLSRALRELAGRP